jgi:hypothetical protein
MLASVTARLASGAGRLSQAARHRMSITLFLPSEVTMKSGVAAICRLLIASMMFLSFHVAHAGMIGTDQVVTSAGQSDRGQINSVLSRAEVTKQLQALGVSPATAKERVAAMTDTEARSLAGQLDSVPAGANHGFWVAVLIIGALVWFWWRGGLR